MILGGFKIAADRIPSVDTNTLPIFLPTQLEIEIPKQDHLYNYISLRKTKGN